MRYSSLTSGEDVKPTPGRFAAQLINGLRSPSRSQVRVLGVLTFILVLSWLSSNFYGSSRVVRSLEVNLGYATYRGYTTHDRTLDIWKGIRYAAAPTGNLRWRAPQTPVEDQSHILDALEYGPVCPQTPSSPPGSDYNWRGDEDCLTLSVFAPRGSHELPVVVYIHGGGYGAGDGRKDMEPFMAVNDNQFVSVVVQYRLEAFGFLASTAVLDDGDLNVAILDQRFALQWIQNHIHKFGGDPRKVTLVGQSAGAGSILMHALAYDGADKTSLFLQGIASSPYVPVTYKYSDQVPEHFFLKFAKEVGCYADDLPLSITDDVADGTDHAIVNDPAIMQCLREADTEKLQRANFVVGSGTNFGSWAFVPVVDGTLLRERPSQQLIGGKVNGRRILTSYNAAEGAQFIDPALQSRDDFDRWLRSEYPTLSRNAAFRLEENMYAPQTETDPKQATCGNCSGPDALRVSSFATGQLQRAMNLYGEITFACPAYWLARAYARGQKTAYLYQFSIPPADHGMDLQAETLAGRPQSIGQDFGLALTKSWGNFIVTGNPSISNLLANGASTGNHTHNVASDWPRLAFLGQGMYQMLNWNQSGGVEALGQPVGHLPPVVENIDPGLRNDIREVDAYTWEGGRGDRCKFLAEIGEYIPI